MRIFTEKEAKEHKCCNIAGSSDMGSVYRKECIASECMAWQWHYKHIGYEEPLWKASVWIPPPPRIPKYEKTDKGYCGLLDKRS